MKISDIWKRRISLPLWALAAILLAFGVLTYRSMPSRETSEAAKVAEWKRRPTVLVCEPRPGERIESARGQPVGPGAQTDAEPVQLIIRMEGCETFLTPPANDDHHE
ncbi:MAG: hypothetical protein ACM30I_01375 [Gemmatimonas sp.]